LPDSDDTVDQGVDIASVSPPCNGPSRTRGRPDRTVIPDRCPALPGTGRRRDRDQPVNFGVTLTLAGAFFVDGVADRVVGAGLRAVVTGASWS
jgi:hypothetical protein